MDRALIAGVDWWPFRFLKTLGKLFTRASVTKQYNLARLVLGWVTGRPGGHTISVCYQPTRTSQPCIAPGSLNRVPASGWGKGKNVASVGWQVTLCDPIWHVTSRSGVAMLHCCRIRTCILYFTVYSDLRRLSL